MSTESPNPAEEASLATRQSVTVQPSIRRTIFAAWQNCSPVLRGILKFVGGIGSSFALFKWGVDMIDIGEYGFAVASLALSLVPIAIYAYLFQGIPLSPLLTKIIKAIAYLCYVTVVLVFMMIAYNKAISSSTWSALFTKKTQQERVGAPQASPLTAATLPNNTPTTLSANASPSPQAPLVPTVRTAKPIPKPTALMPDLRMSFVNQQNAEWRITNHSSEVVMGALFYFVVFNLDQPIVGGELMQPLQIPSAKLDFVNPGSSSGGLILPPNLSRRMKTGERIFGTAELACPGCKNKGYWIYFEQGRGGWFSEMREHTSLGLKLRMGEIAANPEAELEKLVPRATRTQIN